MSRVQNVMTKVVCHQCIGDSFLANEVKDNGTPSQCNYCNQVCEAKTLRDLTDRIHDVLQEHFELTPDYPDEPYEYYLASQGNWERRGDPVDFVIAEIAGLDEELAGDLTSLLSDWFRFQSVKDGMEDPYGSEATYEEREANDLGFRQTWIEFRNEIQFRSRFFGRGVEEMLADIFGDLSALRAMYDRLIIFEISPNDQNRFFWRGRTAQSPQALEAILKSPMQELGPPPSKLAKAGRMNAQGISVFYGATEESTCLSELRPLVGSRVVIGKFELLRTVRLLDLGALAEVYVGTSYFAPDYSVQKGRAAFLRHLVREISQPVLPQDEANEYLPTQVVAEYLAHKSNPSFDGILYPSSQTEGVGKNVVLFNQACGVEPYNLPEGSSVDVRVSSRPLSESEDVLDRAVWITETVSAGPDAGTPNKGNNNKPSSSIFGANGGFI